MQKDLIAASSAPTQSTSLLPKAIALATITFYTFFTLLPNSNSLMVKWPWVFLWQFGLMLGPIALLFQLWQRSFRRLGSRLDWLAGAWCSVLVLSATFAQFSHQAIWYSWAAICNIAFLYVLNSWLTSANRVRYLLIFQGGLSVIFSGLSLISWFFQTVRPYQQTLQQLKSYGIERSFDLEILTLRNWHPIGHQNYVAGYLLLALPLLFGLAFSQRGWQRIAWLGGFALSLVTLYSTASRGSWFGLVASLAVFISLSVWQYPQFRKLLLGSGLIGFGAIALWGVSSDRIRPLFTALFNHNASGAAPYRLITNATGWYMGQDHPILGAGLGSVALLYQKYRPAWAGTEAELTYQLHSTPAQLWAELGIAGALLTLITLTTVSYLSWRCCKNTSRTDQASAATSEIASTPSLVIIGIISGLVGYSVYAITDYQLDNICISGTLIIFIATLIFHSRHHSNPSPATPRSHSFYQRTVLAGAGVLAAVSLWLYPVHRAWMLSSQGFLALQQNDFASFVIYLTKAHELAPWEPYYPYQLAWNLGELAYQSEDAQQQETLRQESVDWFKKANALSPNQEFGYSNLGWLLVNSDPHAATQNFLKATQLVADKRGAFFALGYSLLKENKPELALQAMVNELLQQPALLTSPIWRSPELAAFYPQVLTSFENELNRRLAEANTEESAARFNQLLGSLSWWQGDFDKARMAFEKVPTPLNQAILALAQTHLGEKVEIEVSEETAAGSAIAAWQNPKGAERSLFKSVLLSMPSDFVPVVSDIDRAANELKSAMVQSASFHEWVTQKAPIHQNRNQRLGFGTISRHIDGPLPSDFSAKTQSSLEMILLNNLFPPALF
ncbi:MAG: polymerase [Phormidesmis priestleyi]|uniref:Polymerase n=1 Tax=Phormidesmis priestleyi TaxID=268141 RepID=A0A2W4XDR5_9CYAN|nr:MAG: polymerase [Phormidesmis priestleyi]